MLDFNHPGGHVDSPADPYRMMSDVRRQQSQALAQASAAQIDAAVLRALARRDLSLSDALPRLSRRVQGLLCVVLLDGQPLVEFDPPRLEWSADGRTRTVTIASREVLP